jgi:hypothetical protein
MSGVGIHGGTGPARRGVAGRERMPAHLQPAPGRPRPGDDHHVAGAVPDRVRGTHAYLSAAVAYWSSQGVPAATAQTAAATWATGFPASVTKELIEGLDGEQLPGPSMWEACPPTYSR